jgi:hypothetical protein
MAYPPSGQSPYAPAPARRTNGLAVASLILGLTGFITCGFTSILAVVFGHVSLGQIRRDGTDGHGMALAGTLLGWFLTGAWLLFWLLSWTGVVSTALYSAANPTTVGPARTRLELSPQPGQTASTQKGGHKVVLEVEGKDGAASVGTLTYMMKFDLKQESGITLPYIKEMSADDPYPLSLVAQNAGQEGSITCRIKVDGKVVREAASSGPYGVCNVRADKP